MPAVCGSIACSLGRLATLTSAETRRIRRKKGAVGLFNWFRKVFAEGFLLNHNVGFGYGRVDKRCMGKFYPVFKSDKAEGIFYAVNRLQQFYPKSLSMLFLVADAAPFFAKSFGGFLLFDFGHDVASLGDVWAVPCRFDSPPLPPL